jgi:hypothetical protein
MTLTNFPGGVTSFGMPVLPGGADMTTGNVFFVGSAEANSSDNNAGTEKDFPLATIDAAVGKCTATNGDVIFVMPGHNESLTAATSLVVDVAGVQIIGLGRGNARPILDFDNTAATIEMDAANTRLSNMVLRVSVSACTVGINVDADYVELDNLHFTFEATGDDFLTLIDIDAVDHAYVHDVVAEMELGAAAATNGIRLDDSLYTRIHRCRLVGEWTAAAILNAGALCQALEIRDCVIYNEDTSVYNGIDFGALSSTGLVADCHVTALYDTTVDKVIRTGDMNWHNVRMTNAVSEAAPGDSVGIGLTSST